MATARAIANGNWSATGTWNGGVVPGNGDTVYSNGFTVTLDVPVTIGGANNPTVNTGSLVAGQYYEIVNVGSQNWTLIGAGSNVTGVVFLATGAGTAGNGGTAKALATLTNLTNTAAGATAGGGGFTMPTAVNCFTALRANNTHCLTITATSGSVDGISNIIQSGGVTTGNNGLNITGSGVTVNFVGSIISGGNNGNGVAVATGSTLNITTPVSMTTNNVHINNNGTVNFNAAFTVDVPSNITAIVNSGIININAAGTIAGGSGGHGISNLSAGTININQPCTLNSKSSSSAIITASSSNLQMNAACAVNGSSGAGYAILHSSTGLLVAKGVFTAGSVSGAITITNTTSNNAISGNFQDHWNGTKAIYGSKWILATSPANHTTRYALNGTTDSYFTAYGPDYSAFGNPAITNVRSGTVYGPSSELTGTCAVPAAGSVALGVAVDNTTGTAILTAANVQTALTSQGLTTTRAGYLDNLDATVSSRLASSSYSAAPTVTQVRQEMDSNSTKLANLDATVSSRLASSSYSAPLDAAGTRSAVGLATGNLDTQFSGISSGISGLPSASSIASAVWAAATRTLTTAIDNSATIAAAVWAYASGRTVTGGTVDTLTNAPSVPSAATIASQVRTELSTELSRLDATISSRLAPAGTLARVTLVDTTTTVTNSSPVDAGEIADAVRTELAPELAHLDADVSSRQATLARLQNVATTQEVGDIVEGALGD